jgi:hypothetical protein
MVRIRAFALAVVGAAISACATVSSEQGTLAELQQVEADVEDVYLEDGLERAAQSYRRYLEETDKNKRTPEAMRRIERLKGALRFTLETEYHARLTEFDRNLRDLDQAMAIAQDQYDQYVVRRIGDHCCKTGYARRIGS